MRKGLDVASAKATVSEQGGIPHHLLSFLGPYEADYTVRSFYRDASRLINDIMSRGRVPIVCGGTLYYA